MSIVYIVCCNIEKYAVICLIIIFSLFNQHVLHSTLSDVNSNSHDFCLRIFNLLITSETGPGVTPALLNRRDC